MKSIPSSEFRKTYANLTEPTIVTVLGHDIGEWIPYRGQPVAAEPTGSADAVIQRVGSFGSPKPAPKRGR